MRVVCAFTHIAPGVAEALDATGHPWEAVDVSGDDSNYWGLLADLWCREEPFIVVEHDVLVRSDTLAELEACPEPWCGFAVPYVGGVYPGLACAKFGTEIIAAVPNALEQVATMSDEGAYGRPHPPKHYCRLDAWLQYWTLPKSGIPRHIHQPPLGHYRPDGAPPWPSHGCIRPPEGA